ncbi:unnamed protein product, partial [Prorocentrum cordatum]
MASLRDVLASYDHFLTITAAMLASGTTLPAKHRLYIFASVATLPAKLARLRSLCAIPATAIASSEALRGVLQLRHPMVSLPAMIRAKAPDEVKAPAKAPAKASFEAPASPSAEERPKSPVKRGKSTTFQE